MSEKKYPKAIVVTNFICPECHYDGAYATFSFVKYDVEPSGIEVSIVKCPECGKKLRIV